MLLIFRKMSGINFAQLMDVYSETIVRLGRRDYPNKDEHEQHFLAEQEQYQYFLDCMSCGAVCAVWAPEGLYRSALRLEPYNDAYLLTALETTPAMRRKGYAEALVRAVLNAFSDMPIYSHVARANRASIALHKKCGFSKHLDYATYLDGSVSAQAVTFIYQQK